MYLQMHPSTCVSLCAGPPQYGHMICNPSSLIFILLYQNINIAIRYMLYVIIVSHQRPYCTPSFPWHIATSCTFHGDALSCCPFTPGLPGIGDGGIYAYASHTPFCASLFSRLEPSPTQTSTGRLRFTAMPFRVRIPQLSLIQKEMGLTHLFLNWRRRWDSKTLGTLIVEI